MGAVLIYSVKMVHAIATDVQLVNISFQLATLFLTLLRISDSYVRSYNTI